MQEADLARQRLLAAPVDLAVILFSAWTVLCHAVVFSGGRPATLYNVALTAAVLAALAFAIGLHRLGLVPFLDRLCDAVDPVTLNLNAATRRNGWLSVAFRITALGASLAMSAAYARTHDKAALYIAASCLFAFLFLAQDALADTRFATTQPSPAWTLFLGLCTAAFIDHINCSDADEAFYQAMASSLTRFPDLPILSFEPLHGDPSRPMSLAVYRVHSFELLSAVLAHGTHISPLRISHVLLPAVAGVLLPFFLLRLSREIAIRNALFVVVMTLCVLALDGSEHRSFGNFAMVRFFQGKAIFVTALVPVLLAYGIRFGRQPTRKRFALMACAQIAALGLTSIALPLAPMLTMIGVIVGLPSMWRMRESLPRIAYSAASSLYPLLLAIYLRQQILGSRASDKLEQALNAAPERAAEFSDSLSGLYKMLSRVLGEDYLQACYLGCVLVVPIIASRLGARLATTSAVVFLWLLGNPALQPMVEGHLLGAATYWRALWIIPIPILCAVAWEATGQRLLGFLPGPIQVTLTFGLFLATLITIPHQTTFSAENDARAPLQSLKVDDAYLVAQTAAQLLPRQGGIVLATKVASIWLSAMPQRAYPAIVKDTYLLRKDKALGEYLRNCLVEPTLRKCNSSVLANALLHFNVRVAATEFSQHTNVPLATALTDLGFEVKRVEHGHFFWVRK